jgi:uncharacterized sulfatase
MCFQKFVQILFISFFLFAPISLYADENHKEVIAANQPLSAIPVKPNVIVIFTDDHGWSDLGVQGIQEDLRTPNLDQLASGGVRFTNGYVTAPQCVPSRAGLLTGCYQQRFGLECNKEKLDGFNARPTFPARLQQLGYVTGMTGKWHLGSVQEITRHGFHDVFSTQGQKWSNFYLDGKTRPGGVIDCDLYHLEANAAAACTFIKRHKDESFFFYLAFRAPHTPLDAPAKYTARFSGKMPERRRQALAMLSAVDDGVGLVLETLRKLNLEEKTLLFFIGDNGAPLKIHKEDTPLSSDVAGWDGSLNEPMNGEKGVLSEGGIRTPFLCYWKGNIPAGVVYNQPVISLDVAATVLELAGCNIKSETETNLRLDGVNLLPYLTGQKNETPHETLFWRWLAQSAIREGKWKLLLGGAREYLYDLETDSGETRNLVAEHPEIVTRLRTRLEQWAKELQPAGLGYVPMTKTANIYFDYYLDGKPVHITETNSNNWIVRNGSSEIKDHVFHVIAQPKNKQRLFITNSNIDTNSDISVHLEIRSQTGGVAELTWRQNNQNDFPPEQRVQQTLADSKDWQNLNMKIPATEQRLIHFRIFPPSSVNEIRKITIKNTENQIVHQWTF